MNKFLSNKGFTLVELIVVSAILGILATGLMVGIDPVKRIQQANDGKRKNDLAQIQHALELYYQDHQVYPQDSGRVSEPNGDFRIMDGSARNWGTSWTPYISTIPSDPVSGYKYMYIASADGEQYWIFAHLEGIANDTVINCTQNGTFANRCANSMPSGGSGAACGSAGTYKNCNYGVSSPNASP